MLVSPRAFPMPFAMPSTMKAVAQDSYGTVAVLTTGDVATPTISENQVLIRVRAAGVNIADWAVMNGLPYIARPVYGLRKPKNVIRGTDVAGTVEAVGSSITRFQPGDEVFGSSIGSYAEYSPANEDELALKPVNLSFEQAAAVPMAGLVALEALQGVQAGQNVLINGASGGIGTFAVQIAKSRGADVTGVCSTRNVEMVRTVGANHVIDYSQDDSRRASSDMTSSSTTCRTIRCPTCVACSPRPERSSRTAAVSTTAGLPAAAA